MNEAKKREWCWPLCHDWAKWADAGEYKVRGVDGEGKPTEQVLEFGVYQERRCTVCNAGQRRRLFV